MAYISHVIFLCILAVFQLSSVGAVYTVVLPPIISEGDEVALIVAPGASIAGEAYKPLCVAIQKATPLKLWVSITSGFRDNIPTLVSLEEAVNLAIDDLTTAGMTKGTPIFLAGHSHGGILAQAIVASNSIPTALAGLLLWASYLTGATADLGNFPTPVLHVSGDLDGLTRMTRIGRAFRELTILVASDPVAEYTKSVILVNGVNHGQFASGDMPPNITENDIISDLSQVEAHDVIAEACNIFITANVGDGTADDRDRLHKAVSRTNDTFNPLFVAEDYETSELIIYSQKVVASIPEEKANEFRITIQLYDNQQDFESSKPSAVKDVDGNTVVDAKAKADYPSNDLDNSLIAESATEVAIKMKNQLAIKEVLGDGNYGVMLNCKEINQAVFSWALQMASSEVVKRYNTRGRQMTFMDDIIAETGSAWVNSPLKYAYTVDGDIVVTSTSLYTSPRFIIPNIAGMYYCKQLSPYRAMEWTYVDSLRPYNTT